MAHIVEFSIEGLAGRKEVYSQKLNRDVNIFFGLNGSGKTSLLKILHSALSADATILTNVPFVSAEVKVYSIDSNKISTRTITQSKVVQMDSDEIVQLEGVVARRGKAGRWEFREESRISWKIVPKIRNNSGRLQNRYLPTSRLYLGTDFIGSIQRTPGSENQALSEEQLDRYFAEMLKGLWIRYSAGVLSDVRKAQENGLASILKALLSPHGKAPVSENVDPSVAYERVANFLKRQGSMASILGTFEDFATRYQKDRQLRNVVVDINEVEERIAVAMTPRLRLQNLIERMFSGNKNIKFDDQSIRVVTPQDTDIGLQALSSGEKHILRIFVETLMAGSNSIFIDEPEISLHLDWQKELIADLKELNSDAQIVTATHSAEIMADVPDDRIFRL